VEKAFGDKGKIEHEIVFAGALLQVLGHIDRQQAFYRERTTPPAWLVDILKKVESVQPQPRHVEGKIIKEEENVGVIHHKVLEGCDGKRVLFLGRGGGFL